MLSQIAIVRSALRARAERPDGTAAPTRGIEAAWTVLPAIGLALVLVITWRVLHTPVIIVP